MQPGSAQLITSQPEVDVPGRPDFVNVFQDLDLPIPATAVCSVTPERERRTTRREMVTVYMPTPSPEMQQFARCFAYAYIAPAREAADPAPFISRAIHAAAPRARFELLPPSHGADRTVRFASPDDREAAMAKQPFALDGATVRLVREWETSNCVHRPADCLAHVALLRYPKEQRNQEDIQTNCSEFGHLREVDPACYDAPDLSPVRVVLNLEHPREIPREVRIRYTSDYRFRHVVPVQILRIWDKFQSTDADGKYVPTYSAAAVVP